MSRNVRVSLAFWSLGMNRSWPNSERMNRRLVPSPACVIATGRRGLRLGKARTVLSGRGEVSTGSAATTQETSERRVMDVNAQINFESERIVVLQKGGVGAAKGVQWRDRYNSWRRWRSLLAEGIENLTQ